MRNWRATAKVLLRGGETGEGAGRREGERLKKLRKSLHLLFSMFPVAIEQNKTSEPAV